MKRSKPKQRRQKGEDRKRREIKSELEKFRDLWRDKLPEDERNYWRAQLNSKRLQKEMMEEVRAKYGIHLKWEMELTRMREHIKQQDKREKEAAAVEADKAELLKQGLKGEELREELLNRMKARAIAEGDFALGATAVKLDLDAENTALNERKVELMERKAELLERAEAERAEAKNSKGGLSPETIAKIERELNLY